VGCRLFSSQSPKLVTYIYLQSTKEFDVIDLIIRETAPADLQDILYVEQTAFRRSSEPQLTKDMLSDQSAKPYLSLLAYVENQPAGHILFTHGYLTNNPKVKVSFLAPLAVIPKFQRQGIGGALIKKGIEILSVSGIDLVFVVGHPKYYPRHGFTPASKLGFEPTYPIPKEVADAWMVQELHSGIIGSVSGKVICCDVMNKPEVWRE
jgi:putative acetyltransferase